MKKTYEKKLTMTIISKMSRKQPRSLGVAAVHTCFSSQYNTSEQKLQETAQTSQQ